MADDDDIPPAARKRRLQSQTERDIASAAARRERLATASGVPQEIEPEDTGVIKDPAKRKLARRKRSTEERVEHAEDRLDDLVNKLIDSQLEGRRMMLRALTHGIAVIVGAIAEWIVRR